MRTPSLRIAVVLLFVALVVIQTGICQGPKPFDSTNGGDVDSVSLTGGGLTLNIPLASFPQRGQLDLSFFIRYTTPGWQKLKSCIPNGDGTQTCTTSWTPTGFQFGAEPSSSTDWRFSFNTKGLSGTGLVAQSPDGGGHFMNGGIVPVGSGCGSLCQMAPEYPSYSMDGTGIVATNGTTLTQSNGTVIGFAADVTGAFVQASTLTDANGNRITIGSSGWNDSLGRAIPGSAQTCNSPGFPCPPNTTIIQPGVATTNLGNCPSGTSSALAWNIPGVGGATRTFMFCYSNVLLQTSFGGADNEFSGTSTMLTAIVRPDLSLWTISYDGYGGISRLGMPTGGSISYTYANAFGFTSCGSTTCGERQVIQRAVDANDGAGPHATKYAYSAATLTTASNGGTQTTFTTTVTSPDGNDCVHTMTNPIVGPGTTTMGQVYEIQAQYFQGPAASGTLLQTTTTQYSGAFDTAVNLAINIVPAQTTTTLPGGQTSKAVFTYNSSGLTQPDGTALVLATPLQQDEYDFSGSLYRSTLMHYLWQDSATYKNANFLALPVSTTVKDSSGNQIAQTSFAYDQVGVSASGVAGLVGPPAGGNIRGNVTTISRWLNPGNALLSTNTAYFDTGMASGSSDALGNQTAYTYDPSGTFRTKTCNPVTNNVHHCTGTSYDLNTGVVDSVTDQNGQTTSYQYDNMLRTTQISFPDGGQTNFSFASPTTIERQRKIDSSRTDDSIATMDGMGRLIQTKTNTPSGAVYVDTTYDGNGRVAAVTNPFYSTNDTTYGTTQYQYDALGRTTNVTEADGSVSSKQYSNNCVTVTDEAGKPHKGCSDAFGRVIELDEPQANSGGGAASGGTVAINGNLQSIPPGTQATGSVTINPSTGGDRSTTITTQAAASATATVTIGGSDSTNLDTVQTCAPHCMLRTTSVPDSGTVSLQVVAGGVTYSSSAPYNVNSSTAGLAQTLVSNFQTNSLVSISYSGGSSFTLTAAAGSTGNGYTFSASATSNCHNTSTPDNPVGWTCGGEGWTTAPGSGNLSGGKDAVTQTIYDTGTITITVNNHGDSVSFGSSDSANSIASNLASAINADGNAPESATASANVVNLKFKSPGTGGNVPLASSYTWDTSHFSSANFTTANSGSALTGGTGLTGTVYDAGTVSLSVGGYTASVPYGQTINSTATQVATALAAGLNSPNSPVNASASGASVTLTYRTVGTSGNVAVSASSSTSESQYFNSPSFTSPGTTLTGGSNPQIGFGNPYVTLYSYDLLDNLVQVNQKGDSSQAARVRSFTFDSLSRMLTAINPESGLVTYTYDADGNQRTRQDARGLTITSVYDAMNRLTSKTYSDGTTGPQYVYDNSSSSPNTNSIGRLVYASNSVNAASSFGYDPMGRVNYQSNPTPSASSSTANLTTATYDLLGDMSSLTYPSGRTVAFSYNTGDQLDQVQMTQFGGSAITASPYWSVAANNFYPTNAPKSVTLASGAVESYSFNPRLQLAENSLALPGVATFADYAYNYILGTNNGNIADMYDKLNPSRTQSYTYDALNRLSSASESRWGLGFVYDPWNNRLQQNVTAGSGFSSVVTVDANNHIQGAGAGCTSSTAYCYDPAGHLLNDGVHQYNYNIEERIISVDNANATYTYDGVGHRIRKDASGLASIEYIYFAGQVIAEHNITTGDWDDYIFANGTRVAKAPNYENRILIAGTNCSSCGAQSTLFTFNGLSWLPYTVQTGDHLFVRMEEDSGNGGVAVSFSDGSTTRGSLADSGGVLLNTDSPSTNWHVRIADLSAYAGKSLSSIALVSETTSGAGAWQLKFKEMSLVSADGTVRPIYVNETGVSLSVNASSGVTGPVYSINHGSGPGGSPDMGVTYYHNDRLGTSRLLTADGGYPVWQGTFLPFGEEYNPQVTTNHYKFTGYERDTESGLDNAQNRFYSIGLGRFMSADPFSGSSNLNDPQSFNRYTYVSDNPANLVDPTGLIQIYQPANPGNVVFGFDIFDALQSFLDGLTPDAGFDPGNPARGLTFSIDMFGNIMWDFKPPDTYVQVTYATFDKDGNLIQETTINFASWDAYAGVLSSPDCVAGAAGCKFNTLPSDGKVPNKSNLDISINASKAALNVCGETAATALESTKQMIMRKSTTVQIPGLNGTNVTKTIGGAYILVPGLNATPIRGCSF